jgi:hypothetical protein
MKEYTQEEIARFAQLEVLKQEKHFLDMTKEEQEEINRYDLKEMAIYYGGWKELRRIIDMIEEDEAVAAAERAYEKD